MERKKERKKEARILRKKEATFKYKKKMDGKDKERKKQRQVRKLRHSDDRHFRSVFFGGVTVSKLD